MKLFIIGSTMLVAWVMVSIFMILSDGVHRQRKVMLQMQFLERDLKDMYEVATLYKGLHGSYPSSMAELTSYKEVKTRLETLDSYKINPESRDLEPLIEYRGYDKRLANYKVLENGIVTRANVISSIEE